MQERAGGLWPACPEGKSKGALGRALLAYASWEPQSKASLQRQGSHVTKQKGLGVSQNQRSCKARPGHSPRKAILFPNKENAGRRQETPKVCVPITADKGGQATTVALVHIPQGGSQGKSEGWLGIQGWCTT